MEEILKHDFNGTTNECDVNATIFLHSRWIYQYFGDCVVEARQYIAFVIGTISIFCWLVAQLPQIIVNCRTGKADESLSFWFLLLWLFSDAANFLGGVLTSQLTTQIAEAAYFVLIDTITLVQFILHLLRNQGLKGMKRLFQFKRHSSDYVILSMVALVLLVPNAALLSPPSSHDWHFSRTQGNGRNLLEMTESPPIDIHDSKFMIGYALGWVSAVVYFFALPPQIIKNCTRCSVEGVSLLMFIFVTLGDSTYLTSVLLFSVDRVFLLQKLPWIVGSAVSVLYDLVILVQILAYKYINCARSRQIPDDRTSLLKIS